MARPRGKEFKFDSGKLFDRVGQLVGDTYTPDNLAAWIEKNTKLQGKPFSFKNHEYQLRVLKSEKRTTYVKKCSQLGISELAARDALATSYMIPYFNTILTLPTSDFASLFAKTRIDPIIRSSDLLKDAVNTSQDSTEYKGIATSQLYIRGTFSANAAISVPADYLIHDEVDFSDQDTLTSFQSRLTHSPYKWRLEISTPTLPDYGIDERFNKANRFFNFCKCVHCNHDFIPNYGQDVVVPGYDGDIFDLDGKQLHKTRWDEAYLRCPRCGKRPDLSPQYRRWVCENPDERYEAEGIQISPFDAPAFITVQNLMESRTRYKRTADFINFSLGQCMEDSLSGIQEADLDLMERTYLDTFVGSVLGIDMGSTCTVVEARIDSSLRMMVVDVHFVPLKALDTELRKIVSRVRPFAMVMDMYPYTETVMRLQKVYPNLYGCGYVNTKSLRAFRFADEEEDRKEAILDVRQINANRDISLDGLMEDIRAHRVGVNPKMKELESFRKQMRDMRRILVEPPKNQPDQERFRWVKSKDGDDHSHHGMNYAWIAAQINRAARQSIVQISAGSLLLTPKVKTTI